MSDTDQLSDLHDEGTGTATIVRPRPKPAKPKHEREEETKKQPPYNVILHDDNDHSYEYVIDMLTRLFGHSIEKAFQMACEVDATGRVIVFTTAKEHAEMKRDLIHAFGADPRLGRSAGSMSASIEPAPG